MGWFWGVWAFSSVTEMKSPNPGADPKEVQWHGRTLLSDHTAATAAMVFFKLLNQVRIPLLLLVCVPLPLLFLCSPAPIPTVCAKGSPKMLIPPSSQVVQAARFSLRQQQQWWRPADSFSLPHLPRVFSISLGTGAG